MNICGIMSCNMYYISCHLYRVVVFAVIRDALLWRSWEDIVGMYIIFVMEVMGRHCRYIYNLCYGSHGETLYIHNLCYGSHVGDIVHT